MNPIYVAVASDSLNKLRICTSVTATCYASNTTLDIYQMIASTIITNSPNMNINIHITKNIQFRCPNPEIFYLHQQKLHFSPPFHLPLPTHHLPRTPRIMCRISRIKRLRLDCLPYFRHNPIQLPSIQIILIKPIL